MRRQGDKRAVHPVTKKREMTSLHSASMTKNSTETQRCHIKIAAIHYDRHRAQRECPTRENKESRELPQRRRDFTWPGQPSHVNRVFQRWNSAQRPHVCIEILSRLSSSTQIQNTSRAIYKSTNGRRKVSRNRISSSRATVTTHPFTSTSSLSL